MIGVGLVQALSRVFGIDLRWTVQRAMLRIIPPPPLGIHRLDPVLGTRHAPNSIGRHEGDAFKVVYSIDSQGARFVPGAGADRPLIEVLGDSFTFGHGVEDNETYAAVLQRLLGSSVAVRNRGVMGWGTLQSMMILEEDFGRGDPIQLVTYGWLPFQNQRNYRSKGWLQILADQGQRLPLFEVIQGRPVYQRLIGPEEGLPDGTDELRQAEWNVTEAALLEMAKMSESKRSQFLVILLPFQFWMGSLTRVDASFIEDSYAHLEEFLQAQGIKYLNLRRNPQFSEDGMYLPHDLHPTALWHRLVAEALAEMITMDSRGIVAIGPNGQGHHVVRSAGPVMAMPSPDIGALVALVPDEPPNTLNIPGPTGTALFGVTTVNRGGPGRITATAEADSPAISVAMAICRTFPLGHPQQGECQEPLASAVTLPMESNATPSFAVAVTATRPIPFEPATNRVTVRFRDGSGKVRGSTSVAVQTK